MNPGKEKAPVWILKPEDEPIPEPMPVPAQPEPVEPILVPVP